MSAKGRAIIRTKDTVKVPWFNPLDYQKSLISSLNYYNEEVDSDEKKRAYAYEYWEKQGLDTSKLNSLPDSWFHTYGAIAHMVNNGVPLHDSDIFKLNDHYNVLLGKVHPVAKKPAPIPVPVVDHTNAIASQHIAVVESAFDAFIDIETPFDLKAYIQSNELKAPVVKKIGEWFIPTLAELQAAYDHAVADITDAYKYMGKRKLKRVVDFVANIISTCDTMATVVKTMRKPRAKKVQPVGKVVEKLQFMRSFPELQLTSIDPTKIVGSSQLWVYNTKIRRLFKYEALDDYGLSVKGTTLQNWNPEKSGSKIIRKPEVQLHDANKTLKRAMNAMFNDIKATTGKVTGRISDECVIIGVF